MSLKVRRRLSHPTAKCKRKEEATVYAKELDLFVTVMLLQDTPAVLSLGKLCEDHGHSYHWAGGQKPQLIKSGRRIKCNTANYVPIFVSGLSTGSSSSATPTSPTSLPQEAEIPTQYSASTISESASGIERVRGENPSQNDNERVRGNPFLDLPQWLEEFTENLVDDSVPVHRNAPASFSRAASKGGIGQAQY